MSGDELKELVSQAKNGIAELGKMELQYLNLQHQLVENEKPLRKLYRSMWESEDQVVLTDEETELLTLGFAFAVMHTAIRIANSALDEFKEDLLKGSNNDG